MLPDMLFLRLISAKDQCLSIKADVNWKHVFASSLMERPDILDGMGLLPIPTIPLNINLRLCSWARLAKWNYNLCDPFWQIYWTAQSGWFIHRGRDTIALPPDKLIVIPPDTVCTSESRNTAEQLFIHFTMNDTINVFRPGIYLLPLSEGAIRLIQTLKHPEQKDLGRILRQTFAAERLCLECLAMLPADSVTFSSISNQIRHAAEAMIMNIRKPLSNDELANTVAMSTSLFIRRFRQELGRSPQNWYLERRVNHAASLLLHTDKTIEEIADETAFSDRGHLSRVFKRFKGIGPAMYRKRAEGRKQSIPSNRI